LIINLLRGFKQSADTSLSQTNAPYAIFTNWDPLLQAVVERVSQFEETDLSMIRSRTPRSKHVLGEYPTLVVGRLEPLLASATLPADLFIHAFGLIAPETVPGSEERGWLRAGFDVQRGKRRATFGKGPLHLNDLPASFLSALDVFSMFYGVTDESLIITLGDPELEQALERTAEIHKVRAGRFLLN
jgi:hypothetical protein